MKVLLRDLTPGQDYLMQFRTNDGTNVSPWSPVYQFTTIGDGTPPSNPSGLDWKPTGESFIGTWTAPTTDGNGKALKDFSHYEVTVEAGAKSKVYTTSNATWEFTLVMNAEAFGGIELTVKITVKSVDSTGNKSSGINMTATEDTPPVPSAPIITNASGQIAVEWNGSTSVGVINAFNLQYVEIHASKTNNFTPSDATIVGRFEGWIAGRQQTIVPGLDYGSLYYFKLVSVNKKNKKSTPSAQASGTPTRISGLEIQNGTITTDQINFTSSLGGSRAWYQTTAPTTAQGAKDNDTWFDTDDGYHNYVRVSGAWLDVRDTGIANADQKAIDAAAAAAAANTAALSAAGIANSKGKVYVQSTAPAGDANSLWIDTTGAANTPKRWSGSAWVAVTDKVATDAATAAANAAQAATDAASAATTAQNTANSKNQVTYSTADPSGNGTRAGDIWFKRDGAGIIIGQWEWTGSAWTARTIGNQVIANLDAGKITAGTLDAARIAAGTLTADKISVGDFTDFIPNPKFDPTLSSMGYNILASNASEVPANAPAGNVAKLASRDHAPSPYQPFPVSPGDQIYTSVWVAPAATTGSANFNLYFFGQKPKGNIIAFPNSGIQNSSVKGWRKVEWIYTVPLDGTITHLTPLLQIDQTSPPAGTVWYVTDWHVRRVTPSVLISDGAVTAAKINAGAITADKVGTNLIITAAANIGNAVIDDAKIASLKSGKIVAEETATNLIIANTANIKDAIITSAKILNLSADKITTGSLQANQKIISGPLNGDHAEMSSTGFRVYTNDPLLGTPTEVIRMGTDTNDFFGVVNSAQELVASIDDSGASSFRRVVVKEEVLINGVSVADMLKGSSAGMVGYWGGTITNLEQAGNIGIKETEYGVAQVTFPVVAGRTYYIRWQLPFYYATAAEGEIWQRLVYRINGTPVPGNAVECGVRVTNSWKINSYQKDNLDGIIVAPSTGNCTVMMTMRYPWGTTNSVVKVAQNAWTEAQAFDMGKAGIAAGGQSSGFGNLVSVGSPPPAPPAPPPPTQQYFVDLAPAGWASYRGDGSLRPGGDGVTQGWDPSGFNGDGGGFWYFFIPSITGVVDLATFYCYSNHWYYNSGGTAIFNLIPNGVNSNFASFKLRGDMYIDGFPKPGGKEVLLPGDWLPFFRNGGTNGSNQAVGISVGRANNTNLTYYGRFDGPSARLRIYYTQ